MTPADASEHRDEFCARLKHEREHRGVSVAHIANHTKIKASLLDALERGDLSRWPKGIYRRAFFRDYVTTVGLPLETYMTEFVRLFGERDEIAALDRAAHDKAVAFDKAVAAEKIAAAAKGAGGRGALDGTNDFEQTAPLDPAHAEFTAGRLTLPVAAVAPSLSFRLTFGDTSVARRATLTLPSPEAVPMRLFAALTDVAFVLALGYAFSWALDKNFWQVSAIVAMLDLAVTTFTGRSPSSWIIERAAAMQAGLVPSANTGRTPRGPSVWTRAQALGPQLTQSAHAAREFIERFSYGLSMTSRNQRRRDIMGMRRRRVEAANAAVDEAGIV